jgi:hypothetical protein
MGTLSKTTLSSSESITCPRPRKTFARQPKRSNGRMSERKERRTLGILLRTRAADKLLFILAILDGLHGIEQLRNA